MRRVVIVPSTLALLPEYASIDDPIADLRAAVLGAVDWLRDGGPAEVLSATAAARRIGEQLLGSRRGSTSEAGGSTSEAGGPTSEAPGSAAGLLVVANGSARRTEKAPGHFDDRAAAFDAAIGKALADGDPAALVHIDPALAEELWAWSDAQALAALGTQVRRPDTVHIDYDDDPYGVQYWVMRMEGDRR